MNKYSDTRRYCEDAFHLRLNIYCAEGFPEDKLAAYVQGEELIHACVKCSSNYQYYMDVALPYNFDFELLQADILEMVPDIIRIDAGVVSYELCTPRDISIGKKHKGCSKQI